MGIVSATTVDDVFTYHPPVGDDAQKYEAIRSSARRFAQTILENTPVCADQQAALRLLRESVMTANASIALKGAI